jgi:uncharacterized protein (DUF2147 family)
MFKYPCPSRTRGFAQWLRATAFIVTALALSPALAQQVRPGAPANAPSQAPPPPPGPVGVWIDHTGRGAVEIAPCEQGQGLCGRIVWLQQPVDKLGQPLRDKLNENRRLRDRPICGLQIMGDLKPMRDGSWDRGWIYDPEQGESFDVELRLRGPDVLQVTGYKGLKFFSETFRWRRAPEIPTPPCPTISPA